jgi:RNA polymerase sigma-70 factor (ECF subfamily)
MDDATAIRRCRAGDSDAFRHVVERYQAQAIGHAAAIVGNRDDALDAVQEAFIDAFRSLSGFEADRKFYPWFYVLLRNRCYKLIAGRRRHEAESIEETLILSTTAGIGPEETLSLEMALMELEPEDRELITLKHLDGLSYTELSERLGIPEGTVMSRLYHARKRLQGKLSRVSTKSYSRGSNERNGL